MISSANVDSNSKFPKAGTPSRSILKHLEPSITPKPSRKIESVIKDWTALIDIHTGNFPNSIINIGEKDVRLTNKIEPIEKEVKPK